MAEPDLPTSGLESSSSHKRRFDAMGPDGDTERPTVQNAGSSSALPPARPSSVGGSRERNKRARNDMSDSSYTTEVDDLLIATVQSVSPSNSDSSQSSYHSAHSTLPAGLSSVLESNDEDEDDMLVDPVIPEPSAASTPPLSPSFLQGITPRFVPQQQSSPPPPSAAASRESRPPPTAIHDLEISIERVAAFDRAIAPLRRSPVVRPTSSPASVNPLPAYRVTDDFGIELQFLAVSAPSSASQALRGDIAPRRPPSVRPLSSSSSRRSDRLPPLLIPDDFGIDIDSFIAPSIRPSGSTADRRDTVPQHTSPNIHPPSTSSRGARPLPPLRIPDDIDFESLIRQDRSTGESLELGDPNEVQEELQVGAFPTEADMGGPYHNTSRFARGNLGGLPRIPEDAARQRGRYGVRAQEDPSIANVSQIRTATRASRRFLELQEERMRRLLEHFPPVQSATLQPIRDATPRSRQFSPWASAGSDTRAHSRNSQDSTQGLQDLLRNITGTRSQVHSEPELLSEDIPDLLQEFDDYLTGYSRPTGSAHRTTSQADPDFSRAMRTRASPRVPPSVPNSDSVASDVWSNDHERRVQEVMRETDAHRQRMVELLSEPLPHLPTFSFGLPTSSYSTLRHALDDHAIPEDDIHGRSVSGRPSGPSDQGRGPRVRNIAGLRSSVDDYYDYYSTELPERDRDIPPSALGGRNYGLPWSARGSSLARTAGENHLHSVSDRDRPSPVPSRLSIFRDVDEAGFGTTNPYLEATIRARSLDLDEFRNVAHPRNPSSPPSRARSPTPPLPSRPESRNDGIRFIGDSAILSSSSLHSSSALTRQRTAEDNAMLQSFRDGMSSARRVPPQRATRPLPSPPPLQRQVEGVAQGDRPRQTRYGNINLDAYRDGPFRATLARSVALQQQRATPSLQDGQSGRDEERASYSTPWSRHFALWESDRRRPEPAERSHFRSEIDRMREEMLGTHVNEMDGLRDPPEYPISSRPRPNAPLSGLEPSMPSPFADLPMYNTPPHNTESRSSAVFERRPNLRQRSLLDREHAPEQSWTRLEREMTGAPPLPSWSERRREIQRLLAQHRETNNASTASPRANVVDPSTRNDNSRPDPQPWHRRYSRPAVPPNLNRGEPRTDDRPAPLQGRFARRGGPGQHYPPDMVWVDVPHGGRRAHVHRRSFGDYVRDEDFDFSYEGLLSLSSLLGDVKPRGTSSDVIASLPRGTYGEWATPGATEERCPICLDDYQAADPCLRIGGCSHWFHEGCLQQWLKGARTCPVCRGRVSKPRTEQAASPVAGPSGSNNRRNPLGESDSDDREDEERFSARYWNPFRGPPWRPN